MNEVEMINVASTPKLKPEWKQAPSVEDLKNDFLNAKSDHDAMVATVTHWLKVLEARSEPYIEKLKEDQAKSNGSAKLKTRSTYTAKLVRKQCEWRYPSLSEPFLSTIDLFKVSPKTHLDVLSARQNELLLNHQFNTQIDRVHFIDNYVRAAVNTGHVIVKTSWKEKKRKLTREVPVYNFIVAETEEQIAELNVWIDLFESEPDKFEQLVTPEWEEAINLTMQQERAIYPLLAETRKEKVEITVANHPVVEVCNYRHVIVDPTCKGKIEDAKFVIHMFETCLADLKEDGRYTNLDYINVSSAEPLTDTFGYSNSPLVSFRFNDRARKKLVAYEYWGYRDVDGSGTLSPFVATWVGNTLIQLEENPYEDGSLPFVAVSYMPVEDSLYGEADAELLEDNQRVISAVSRGVIDLMGKSANAQTGMRKDALDAANRIKFQRGDDFEVNPNVDPNNVAIQLKYPEIPQSAEYMIQRHSQEAEALTGTKSFSSTGITGAALGSTATGVRSAMDATAKRDSDILRRLGEGVVKIGRKMLMMNAMFLDQEEVVRITDEEFVPIKKDNLSGTFDLTLTISTAEADNQKAEELSFMLQTTAQYIGPVLTQTILADIARLRKMPELAKKIESYRPEPNPLEQRKLELEVSLLEAQVENELASAMKKEADAGMAPVKAETELAKQRKLAGEADLNDLNFIEQERGVKQERELQKAQAQALGNIELEKAKANLKSNKETVNE